MKKNVFMIIAVLAIFCQNVSAQYAKIMLHHNGKATLFERTNLQGAINASVDGDTVYVGEGPYTGNVTINKKISIVGQGVNSQLDNVTISIPAGSELTSTVLYGVNAKDVTINTSVSNLHIDKCTMSNLTIRPASTTSTKTYKFVDMLIERSSISNRLVSEYSDGYENCIFRNCFIQYFSNKVSEISFINCSLNSTYAYSNGYSTGTYDYMYGNYINCKIKSAGQNSSASSYLIIDNSTTFVNCQLGFTPYAGTKTNCYYDSGNYSDEELQVKGYLGTDGTIVGYNGGVRPYNLVPSVPSLNNIQLDVNYNTRKLNVRVNVKAN